MPKSTDPGSDDKGFGSDVTLKVGHSRSLGRRRVRIALTGAGAVVLIGAVTAAVLLMSNNSTRVGAIFAADAIKVGDVVTIGSNQVQVTGGALSGGSFVGTATLQVPKIVGTATAGVALSQPVSFSYANADNWQVSAVGTTTDSLRFDSVVLPRSAMTGTMRASGGVVTSTLATAMSGPTTLISGKFSFNSATMTLSPTCPTTTSTRLCVSGSMFVSMVGIMTANFGSPVTSHSDLPFTAVVNLNTGVSNLEALYPQDEKAAISSASITNMVLRISAKDDSFAVLDRNGSIVPAAGNANDGLNIQIIGKGKVALPNFEAIGWNIPDWNVERVSLTYVNGGLVLVGQGIPKSVGKTSVDSFAYFDAEDTLATIFGNTITIPKRTVVFGMSTSDISLTALLHLSGLSNSSLDVPVGKEGMFIMYTANGNATLGWTIPDGVKLPSFSSDYTFKFTGATISVEVNPNPAKAWQATLKLAQNGLLSISGSSGSVKDIAVQAAIAYTYPLSALTLSVSANGLYGKAVWPNVAGIDGLDLNGFAISGTLSTATGLPIGVGLAGDGILGGKIRSLINPNGSDTPVKFIANISAVAPCIDVAVGDPDGTANVVNLGPGVLSATYAHLYAAPIGCTVGTYTVPAGFSLTFRGKVIGVATDVYAAINTNVPISLKGSGSIGTISVGGYSLSNASLGFQIGGYQAQYIDVSGTVSASDQSGSKTLGLKAQFAGDITFGLTGGVGLKANNVQFDAYYGLAGWHHIGSGGAYVDGSSLCYKKKVSGKTFKVCVP
ncbi:unannotated protein [freshwater metagenome]|uniref:Unannotated protein n=1 Tax=freshwater metagenome TaxID=449393 RepID=A0A6J7I5V5_9ZZZZ|nr:hypothetical protein [Actinomycetota bacterium]